MFSFTIFLIGFLVGYIVVYSSFKRKNVGSLRIDNSNPDSGPYLFLEIEAGKSHLIQDKKSVVLKVHTENYISQE